MRGGASQREIARALGVGVARINSDLHVLRKRWRQEAGIATADHIALALQKLDEWEMAITNAMRSGDTKAIDTGLRIEERRAALLGLDAPRRVEQRVQGQVRVGPPIEELIQNAERILGMEPGGAGQDYASILWRHAEKLVGDTSSTPTTHPNGRSAAG